jgi:hypothetical protein
MCKVLVLVKFGVRVLVVSLVGGTCVVGSCLSFT